MSVFFRSSTYNITANLNAYVFMNNSNLKLGKYLTLEEFCTCTQTYHKYTQNINPYPQNLPEVIPALQDLNKFIIDPIIDY
ncbi:MAG: hypothetical protein ACKPCI_30990, partial [Dolichospermum sp.]